MHEHETFDSSNEISVKEIKSSSNSRRHKVSSSMQFLLSYSPPTINNLFSNFKKKAKNIMLREDEDCLDGKSQEQLKDDNHVNVVNVIGVDNNVISDSNIGNTDKLLPTNVEKLSKIITIVQDSPPQTETISHQSPLKKCHTMSEVNLPSYQIHGFTPEPISSLVNTPEANFLPFTSSSLTPSSKTITSNNLFQIDEKKESICMNYKGLLCKCIVSQRDNLNSDEDNIVAFTMLGNVILTTERILFIIEEETNDNSEISTPCSSSLSESSLCSSKMFEIHLENIESIQTDTKQEKTLIVIETPTQSLDLDEGGLIKKYELSNFEDQITFDRAFRTFTDMLNLNKQETFERNKKEILTIPISEQIHEIMSKKKEEKDKHKEFTSRSVNNSPRKENAPKSNPFIITPKKHPLSPLEEAISMGFYSFDNNHKVVMNSAQKPKKSTVEELEMRRNARSHRRSLSLNSPMIWLKENEKDQASPNSDQSTLIQESTEEETTPVLESKSVDKKKEKKEKKKKKQKSKLKIPKLIIEPPSQSFDEQFEGYVDEVCHLADGDEDEIEPIDIFQKEQESKTSHPKMKTLIPTKKFQHISCKELFDLCFSNTSNFLFKFHESVGDRDIEIYDWLDFKPGVPSVRGIMYRVGDNNEKENFFSSVTQNATRVLETQRIIFVNNNSITKPMSYFILYTSAATQDLPNNEMFQFELKLIVRDTKPSNLRIKKECEMQVYSVTQCKGGNFFFKSKSIENNVTKAVKNRFSQELQLMDETIKDYLQKKRRVVLEQMVKSWEATVASTISGIDGDKLPSQISNQLLPPPICLDASPPPSPRGVDETFSGESLGADDEELDELTCGSTSSVGLRSEQSESTSKKLAHTIASHLTLSPPPITITKEPEEILNNEITVSLVSSPTENVISRKRSYSGKGIPLDSIISSKDIELKSVEINPTPSSPATDSSPAPPLSPPEPTIPPSICTSSITPTTNPIENLKTIEEQVDIAVITPISLHRTVQPIYLQKLLDIGTICFEVVQGIALIFYSILIYILTTVINFILEPSFKFVWKFRDMISLCFILLLLFLYIYCNIFISQRLQYLGGDLVSTQYDFEKRYNLAKEIIAVSLTEKEIDLPPAVSNQARYGSDLLQKYISYLIREYLIQSKKLRKDIVNKDQIYDVMREYYSNLKIHHSAAAHPND
ncbi:hypothetical protein ABK040_016750 [Willaertia magna]